MSFSAASHEAGLRFLEVTQLLMKLKGQAAGAKGLSTQEDKAIRGLVLVAIYGAFERSLNAFVEAAIDELNSFEEEMTNCSSSVQALGAISMIQSLRDCGGKKVYDRAKNFLEHSKSTDKVRIVGVPFSSQLENVDGKTILWCLELFGLDEIEITLGTRGRLENLRERRNAVAHGRESPSSVGQRFSYEDLEATLKIAYEEITRFGSLLQAGFAQDKHLSKAF